MERTLIASRSLSLRQLAAVGRRADANNTLNYNFVQSCVRIMKWRLIVFVIAVCSELRTSATFRRRCCSSETLNLLTCTLTPRICNRRTSCLRWDNLLPSSQSGSSQITSDRLYWVIFTFSCEASIGDGLIPVGIESQRWSPTRDTLQIVWLWRICGLKSIYEGNYC